MDTILEKSGYPHPDPDPNYYWQASVKTTNPIWNNMRRNKILTDIDIKVGYESETEVFPCHRCVLAMHSPVLETMFSERWRQENMEVLGFAELNPEVCAIILVFMYTDTFHMPTPSLDNCLSILGFASEYIIPALMAKCREWIVNTEGILNEETVLQIYELSVLYLDTELEKAMLNMICSKTLCIFNHPSFLFLSQPNLCRLLKLNELTIAEFDLFEAVYRWAEAECFRADEDLTPENMRLILKEGLHLIRFPAIPADLFATRVVATGLLSLEERVELLTYLCMTDEQKEKVDKLQHFKTYQRSIAYTLKRFTDHGETTFDYGLNPRNLLFQVDRRIQILSLGFYGHGGEKATSGSKYTIELRLSLACSIDYLVDLKETINVEPNQEIFHLTLPSALDIVPNVLYCISFLLMGPETWIGNEIRNDVSVKSEHHGHNITFKFPEARYSNNRFQIPEICFTASRRESEVASK